MSESVASPALTALGVGVALTGAPGPVQAILLTESIRGGIGRGLRALAGVHSTFGLLLACLALGVSVATPTGVVLRALKIAGGLLLLWLAVDGVRSRLSAERESNGTRSLPPAVKGALAIVLNPGGWLFLGAVAAPLFATATQRGGKASALLTAVALLAGAFAGDLAVVLLGAVGLRRVGEGPARVIQVILAVVLAALGVWLLVSGATS